MLYHLLYPLHEYYAVFNVFRYITFRTAYASLTALLLCLLLGPWLIRLLRRSQIGQQIREEGPASHHIKAGTPTMGGVLIVVAIVVPTFLWADLRNRYVWIAMLATLLFGVVGFLDDYIKIKRQRSLGLTARSKIALQLVVGLAVVGALVWMHHDNLYSLELSVPFFKKFRPVLDFQVAGYSTYLPLALVVLIVLVGSSNAVNLTDGLDGLATGCTIIAAGALTVLTYVTGHAAFAEYLDLVKNTYASELTIFCGAMVGASLGFLWYNAYPAEVFMGDVGALAIGGGIGTVAVLVKQELLLPFIGGVFVIEALSVILQVGSFKLRGKRIFRMTPIHHHFDLLGWKEPKIVIRFWLLALIFALFSLTTLKLR